MPQNKRLRILSLYFYPDIATTGQLLTELAIGLTKEGFLVNIITAQPTYEKKNAAINEKFQDVVIKRLWSTQFNKNIFLGKLLNSISFFFTSLVFIIASAEKSPLLIVSNPPFLPAIGVILKKLKNIPFVFLVHDVYPDIAIRLGYLQSPSLIVKIWNSLNKIIFRNAAKIIVLSNSMNKVIMEKFIEYQLEREIGKIEIIHNWADGNFIKPLPRKENIFLSEHALDNKFVVLYSGNLGLFHELEIVIEVANKIHDDSFRFVFIGDGGKKRILEQLVQKYGLNNVLFFPYQNREMLPFSLTAASVSFVTLEENIEGLAMPSKLYTTMAAGNPIIAVCDENSDVSKIIETAQCGFSIRHHDAEKILQHLLMLKNDTKLLANMGNNARKYFEQHFTLEIAVNQYLKALESL